jgi:hypothetical protein
MVVTLGHHARGASGLFDPRSIDLGAGGGDFVVTGSKTGCWGDAVAGATGVSRDQVLALNAIPAGAGGGGGGGAGPHPRLPTPAEVAAHVGAEGVAPGVAAEDALRLLLALKLRLARLLGLGVRAVFIFSAYATAIACT